MLESLLKPVRMGENNTLTFRVPMNEDSVLPLIPFEMYGFRVLYMLEHPKECIGQVLSADAPIFDVTFSQIAEALESVVKELVRFLSISIDEWMQEVYIDPEVLLPLGANAEDPTSFTFRKTFGAWWSVWKEREISSSMADLAWGDEVYPDRPKYLKEWTERAGNQRELASIH